MPTLVLANLPADSPDGSVRSARLPTAKGTTCFLNRHSSAPRSCCGAWSNESRSAAVCGINEKAATLRP